MTDAGERGPGEAGWAAARDPALEALRESFDDVERALLAQLYFAVGDHREGLALARAKAGGTGALALIEARARFGLGDVSGALARLQERLAERPGDLLGLYYRAQFLAQSSQPAEARGALCELIRRMPDFPGALQALAPLVLPGPSYREVLERLHEGLRPRTYLEIGVEHGRTLAFARHSERIVGVDPAPPPARLPPGARMFRMTSDDFFASDEGAQALAAGVDLAFIDGKHWFDYALRDFSNVEAWCGPGSVVALHDCLAVAPAAATRERQTRFWVGDTWKALECLLAERGDLNIAVIPCQPSGLVLIDGFGARAAPLRARLGELIARYLPLPYPYATGELPAHYPLVANAEPHLSRLLASLGRGAAGGARER